MRTIDLVNTSYIEPNKSKELNPIKFLTEQGVQNIQIVKMPGSISYIGDTESKKCTYIEAALDNSCDEKRIIMEEFEKCSLDQAIDKQSSIFINNASMEMLKKLKDMGYECIIYKSNLNEECVVVPMEHYSHAERREIYKLHSDVMRECGNDYCEIRVVEVETWESMNIPKKDILVDSKEV